jgi:hypothetical protein
MANQENQAAAAAAAASNGDRKQASFSRLRHLSF